MAWRDRAKKMGRFFPCPKTLTPGAGDPHGIADGPGWRTTMFLYKPFGGVFRFHVTFPGCID